MPTKQDLINRAICQERELASAQAGTGFRANKPGRASVNGTGTQQIGGAEIPKIGQEDRNRSL